MDKKKEQSLKNDSRNRNDHTGERIVTKHREQDKYRSGYEYIKWSKNT